MRSIGFEAEVPSICETQLTGFIGSGLVMRGRRSYCVRLVAGRAPVCLLDGADVSPDHNATMLSLTHSVRKFFGV